MSHYTIERDVTTTHVSGAQGDTRPPPHDPGSSRDTNRERGAECEARAVSFISPVAISSLSTLTISSWPQSHRESRRVNRKYLEKQSRDDDGPVINNNSRDISDIELEQDYSDRFRV